MEGQQFCSSCEGRLHIHIISWDLAALVCFQCSCFCGPKTARLWASSPHLAWSTCRKLELLRVTSEATHGGRDRTGRARPSEGLGELVRVTSSVERVRLCFGTPTYANSLAAQAVGPAGRRPEESSGALRRNRRRRCTMPCREKHVNMIMPLWRSRFLCRVDRGTNSCLHRSFHIGS